MRIVNLIEDTEGIAGCAYAHGLSFYVETEKHRLLFDLGPSEETLKNAEKLGIDLKKVDTVILSHGHYDHSGGILAFAELNPGAVIYMQESAGGKFFADDGEEAGDRRYREIGIDDRIPGLEQVRLINGDTDIDEELSLFTVDSRTDAIPFTNRRILVKDGETYIQDEFSHEQYLLIREKGKKVLLSGCAHNGIINILDECRRKFDLYPDLAVSGFHLMKKDGYSDEELWEIIRTAKIMKKYPTTFKTCHCTGIPAYRVMKDILGKKLDYVHSGEEISSGSKNEQTSKRRNSFMKWHKFFAWATVFCFIATMVTGYRKK